MTKNVTIFNILSVIKISQSQGSQFVKVFLKLEFGRDISNWENKKHDFRCKLPGRY